MLAACSFLQKSRGTCCQCCQQRLPMNKDQDSFCDSNRVCPQARCSQDLWPQFVHSQSLLSSSFPEILFRRATPLMSRCVHADEKKNDIAHGIRTASFFFSPLWSFPNLPSELPAMHLILSYAVGQLADLCKGGGCYIYYTDISSSGALAKDLLVRPYSVMFLCGKYRF